MLTKRSLLLRPVALMVYLLLGAFFIAGWLWFSQVSDRVLASLTRQTGLTFVDKTLSFDPWQRRLSVNDIQFKEKGVQLSSGQLNFILIYRHWWEPWLGKDAEALSAVELVGANVIVEPGQMTFPLPAWFQELSINDGTLSITGVVEAFSFEQLTLNVAGENKLDVHVSGEVWNFSGTYKTSQGALAGELNLNAFPLADLISIIPVGDDLSSENTILASDSLFEAMSGEVDARLSLLWDKQSGLVLQGSAEGQKGAFSLKGFSMAWQHWQLNDFQFNARDRAQSSAALSLAGADFKQADSHGKNNASVINELNHLLPFSVKSLSVTDSRLEIGTGSVPWLFERIEGSLVAVGEGSKKHWQYQAAAYLNGVGDLQLKGTLSDTSSSSNQSYKNSFTLSLNNTHLAGPLKRYSVLAGYNMQGSRFNLSYDSQRHSGQLAITGWQYKKLNNSRTSSASGDLLIALLTDKTGNATIRFKTKPAKQTGSVTSLLLSEWSALPEQVYRAIDQRFMAIGQAPFDYLSSVTGYAIEPLLRHEAGKTALTQSAYTNLQNLHKALALRPELKVLVNVGVSEPRDWPELSRYKLEEALQELYSATQSVESNSSVMPAKVRAQLLEQMYLATQQQKIPEVGEQSPEQRVQKAEKWLLENWPRAPGQIEILRQARYDYLKDEAGSVGIDSGRIALTLSSGSDQKRSEPDSLLILR
ncbi:hypothetical protein [Endozoicomonas sp.]|uniref:hypothetical protein n=1 Tax=Endozoicomonas sp. TaxID=1892382 RepID=UPI002888649E|nr:hypothetical protein [Endozoicomonas sp.]